jgi:hypothetical protein
MKITIDLTEDVARRINGALFIASGMLQSETTNGKYSQAYRQQKGKDAADINALSAAIAAALAQEVA